MNLFAKLRYTVLGILISALVFGLAMPALASRPTKTIQVSTGITVYVDGSRLNAGEPFLYEGTTYLPVRAIGEAYGKAVKWVGETSSVYIGQESGATPSIMVSDMAYSNGTPYRVSVSERDSQGNMQFNTIICEGTNNYMINNK